MGMYEDSPYRKLVQMSYLLKIQHTLGSGKMKIGAPPNTVIDKPQQPMGIIWLGKDVAL